MLINPCMHLITHVTLIPSTGPPGMHSIAGSTGYTSIAFILPSMFYLKLSPLPLKTREKISAMCLLAMGTLFFLISTTVTLVDAVQAPGGSNGLSDLCNRSNLSNSSSISGTYETWLSTLH